MTEATPSPAPHWRTGYRKEPSLRCTRCREDLPIGEFRLLKHGSRSSWCRPCCAAANREWRARTTAERSTRRQASYVPRPKIQGRCVVCGETFQTHVRRRIYCSRRCEYVAAWRRHREADEAAAR